MGMHAAPRPTPAPSVITQLDILPGLADLRPGNQGRHRQRAYVRGRGHAGGSRTVRWARARAARKRVRDGPRVLAVRPAVAAIQKGEHFSQACKRHSAEAHSGASVVVWTRSTCDRHGEAQKPPLQEAPTRGNVFCRAAGEEGVKGASGRAVLQPERWGQSRGVHAATTGIPAASAEGQAQMPAPR